MEEIFFETDTIMLRKFQSDDADEMFKNYCNNEKVCRYLIWAPHKTIEVTKQYLQTVLDSYKEGAMNWAVVFKETGEVIGAVSIVLQDKERRHYELGAVIGEAYWGRGIVASCIKAVIDFLFVNGGELVKGKCDALNIASGRVMTKTGMLYSGMEKNVQYLHTGEKSDVIHFSISKREYFSKLNFNPEYNKFLKAWGLDAQLKMAIEEMSELTKEICKYFRADKPDFNKEIICEVADVLNTVEQLKFVLGNEKVDKVRKEKILRALSNL